MHLWYLIIMQTHLWYLIIMKTYGGFLWSLTCLDERKGIHFVEWKGVSFRSMLSALSILLRPVSCHLRCSSYVHCIWSAYFWSQGFIHLQPPLHGMKVWDMKCIYTYTDSTGDYWGWWVGRGGENASIIFHHFSIRGSHRPHFFKAQLCPGVGTAWPAVIRIELSD